MGMALEGAQFQTNQEEILEDNLSRDFRYKM